MSNRTLAALVRRAREGTADRDDASWAAALLESGAHPGERLDLLFVIGKAGGSEYKALVEGFLDSPDDPMVARLALQIICNWWALAESCRNQIIRFVRGVTWDLEDGGYVQLVACSAAGEFLWRHDDPEIFGVLLNIFDDQTQRSLVREAAYDALARALGRSWREVTSISHGDWERKVEAAVLDKARSHAGLGG